MQEHSPSLVYSRLDYDNKRVTVHPRPWHTDEGVPNQDQPDYFQGDFRIPQGESSVDRLRPLPWKRGEEQFTIPKTVITFTVSLSVATRQGIAIYMSQPGGATCWANNQTVPILAPNSGGDISYSGNYPPIVCAVADTEGIVALNVQMRYTSMTFRCWRNQFNGACAPIANTTKVQVIAPSEAVDVNGTTIAAGGTFDSGGAGEIVTVGANGDQSAYGGPYFDVVITRLP